MPSEIWKFLLNRYDGVSALTIPQSAQVLSVQTQRNQPCIWCLVDTDAPWVTRLFHTVGTGHPADHVVGLPFAGTYQLNEGQLVYHVFDSGEVRGT